MRIVETKTLIEALELLFLVWVTRLSYDVRAGVKMDVIVIWKLLVYLISLHFVLQETTAVSGGWKKADPKNERVQLVAKEGVEQYEKQTNSMFTSQLVNVVEAETQIVAGVNYRLTLEVGFTGCRKNENRLPSSCHTQQKQICTFIIWDQPWLNSIQLTKMDCGPIKSVQSDNDLQSSDLSVKEAAIFAVSHLQGFSNGLYSIRLEHVIDASKQLTESGVLNKLKLECSLSSCTSAGLLDDCKSGIRNESVICDVEVRDQQSMEPQHVLKSYKCANKLLEKFGLPSKKSFQVVEHLEAFEAFKERYGKQYESMIEEAYRFNVFEENFKQIKFLQDHELGTAKYGVTEFADLTPEEFRKQYLTPIWDQSEDRRLTPAEIPKVTLPTEYDWRHLNAVTPVKNQGSCGSCWAFSVTGNIEGQWAIQKKALLSLSEQELVDCDKLDEGCNGGLPSNAYTEIQRLGGLENENDYPYKGKDDTCHLNKQEIRIYINGSLNISKDENDMAAWLYKNGPLSIGINAFAMQFYFGGISHPWKIFCSPDALDHGVLIVGYGVSKGIFGDTPYWIVKNSWGSFWGEKGYYLVYRGDGTCGLNQMVSSATVK